MVVGAMVKFIKYLLAYQDFRRTIEQNKTDIFESGYFGQPARNNGRLATWATRATSW